MIALHLRRGESGSTPARTARLARATVAQPLTAPAVSPRTKYFCSEKNTINGSAMEMNAADVSSCQFSPREPTRLARFRVRTCTLRSPPRKTYATSRSFQTQRNWKMANAASAGTERGMMRRQKIVKWSAPSIFADSMIDDGRDPMWFGKGKLGGGNP